MADSGPISLCEQNLRVTLADCAAFRTFAGAANQAQALARIHRIGLSKPADGASYTKSELTAYHPLAIVYLSPTRGLARSRTADQVWADGGLAYVRLRRMAASVVKNQATTEELRTFDNEIGDIIEDLCELCGQASATPYFDFHRIGLEYGPVDGESEDLPGMGIWLEAELFLEFGSEA